MKGWYFVWLVWTRPPEPSGRPPTPCGCDLRAPGGGAGGRAPPTRAFPGAASAPRCPRQRGAPPAGSPGAALHVSQVLRSVRVTSTRRRLSWCRLPSTTFPRAMAWRYETVGVLGRGCAARYPLPTYGRPPATALHSPLRGPRCCSVFGEALLARHKASGERRVVKCVPLDGLGAAEVEAALREAVALRQLRHPNIVRCRVGECLLALAPTRAASAAGALLRELGVVCAA